MNIQQLQRDLADKQRQAKGMLDRFTATATDEGRPMSDVERRSVQTLVDEAKTLRARLDRAQGDFAMTAEIERLTGDSGSPARLATGGRSLGAEFASSATYQWLRETRNRRPARWTSESSELSAPTMFAATLDTTGGGGSATVIAPQWVPGIVAGLSAPLVVSDLFAPGRAESNAIVFMKETAFTNAAAPVAEAGTKPESELVFEQVTSPVQKVAHWTPVTEEMLEDQAQIESYVDTRLRYGVSWTEADQILNGTGVAPALAGMLGRAGLAAAVPRGTDVSADAIMKQISAIETATGLRPDGIVLNPTNWQTILLTKDSNGQYYGAGPFAPPQVPTLWGLPVAITSTIADGTALVGAFRQAAQLFRRGGIRVEASNSHSDFFVRNLVAIRAETRVALAVYREAAFGLVTGLN